MSPTDVLLALDWGTSSLRAYRYDASGRVVGDASSADGVGALHDRGPRVMAEALGKVARRTGLTGSAPILACGMVGSRQGWVEAPYVSVPADLVTLVDRLCVVPWDGDPLHVLPGMVDQGPLPSVMRGEETQVVGVLDEQEWARGGHTERLVVLPGTHTKWVTVRGRVVEAVATTMTGEVYALLRRSSILAATMTETTNPHREIFEAAVRLARSSGVGVTSTIFSTRSLGLLERLPPDEQATHLSGLLIGHELLDHQPAGTVPAAWTLAGGEDLCRHYATAGEVLGWPTPTIRTDAGPRGLWRLATAAGLVRTLQEDIHD